MAEKKLTGFEKLTAAELEAFITKNMKIVDSLTNAGLAPAATRIQAMLLDATAELARKSVA